MHLNTSPSTSPTLSIGFASSMDSVRSTSSHRAASSSQGSACAYPSWPTATSLRPQGSFGSSSYISDAELFGLDDDADDLMASSVPYLSEAPSPPRQYTALAAPMHAPAPLAPLFAPAKTEKKQRRKSTRKHSHRAQPMTPISESPETPE